MKFLPLTVEAVWRADENGAARQIRIEHSENVDGLLKVAQIGRRQEGRVGDEVQVPK